MSNNDFPEPLQLFAAEDIKTEALGLGGGAPEASEEERLKKEAAMLEYTRLIGRYVEPHTIKSRWVTKEDMPRLLADAKDMIEMCRVPRGKYASVAALAHSQIEDKDPLRFFVLPSGAVVINPILQNKAETHIFQVEGCMSYPDEPMKTLVPRFNRVTVVYQTLTMVEGATEPSLSSPSFETLEKDISHIFQHECGHLNGSNIYDDNFTPEQAIGLGDGEPVTWGEINDSIVLNNSIK